MTLKEFKVAIGNWITAQGIPSIFAYGEGTRPNGTYATLNVVSIEKLIEDTLVAERQVGGEIKATYKGIRKVMLSMNIYRGESMQSMMDLRSSLSRVITQDYFNDLDIGILNPSDVRHIPEQIGQHWEDRSQCDFFFHVVFSDTEANVGEIKTIEVTNQINGEIITAT